MPEKLASEVYTQYGFMGLIVLLLGAVIVYIIWDKYHDSLKEEKEKAAVEEKKKSGTYVSWEVLDDKIKTLETKFAWLDVKMTGAIQANVELERRHTEFLRKEQAGMERFAVLETNQNHFKEDIIDIKEVLREMKQFSQQAQQKSYDLISEIKDLLIKSKM